MACARLHVICGNCGCNDMWSWEHVKEESEDGEVLNPESVWLWCGNCSTLHDINENAKRRASKGDSTHE